MRYSYEPYNIYIYTHTININVESPGICVAF